ALCPHRSCARDLQLARHVNPADTELASAYLRTEVSVALPDKGWVTATEAARGAPTPLYVITAWNPGDARPDAATNRRHNRQLRARLNAVAIEVYAALGASIDSDHFEESYAVAGLTKSEALALGREFKQAAIFEITSQVLTVLSCDGDWECSRDLRSSDDVA